MSKCAACEALQRALVKMGRVATAEKEAAVAAERERVLRIFEGRAWTLSKKDRALVEAWAQSIRKGER